jgi:hypothetical protein
MALVLEGKSTGSDEKTVWKGDTWFGEPRIRVGTKV